VQNRKLREALFTPFIKDVKIVVGFLGGSKSPVGRGGGFAAQLFHRQSERAGRKRNR